MLILIIKANEFGKKEKLLGILISNMVVFDMCKPKFKNLMQRCIWDISTFHFQIKVSAMFMFTCYVTQLSTIGAKVDG